MAPTAAPLESVEGGKEICRLSNRKITPESIHALLSRGREKSGRCAANNNNNHNGRGIDIHIGIGNFTPKVPKTFQ